MMITRISFATDGSEDEFRYATIDTDASDSDEGAYLLKAAPSGPIRILDIEPDTSAHQSEPSWRWCIIRFPLFDKIQFAEATSDPSGGTLTIKYRNSDGTLAGDNITVYDGGIT
jgi:hypothetical protein